MPHGEKLIIVGTARKQLPTPLYCGLPKSSLQATCGPAELSTPSGSIPMATNTASKSTRRVYSAEELHRLRNTQSQPKLSESIEEHEGEDAELVKGMIGNSTLTFFCTAVAAALPPEALIGQARPLF